MQYSTAQKKILTDYLENNADKAMTAAEIYEGTGGSIGKSTVYRLLAELAERGGINRFAKSDGKGTLYQLSHEKNCSGHLHMKCLKCEKLYHMNEEESERITEAVKNGSDFSLSESSTVLFGICAECGKK